MRYVIVDLTTNLVINWIDDTDDIDQFYAGDNCIFVQSDIGVLGDLYIDGVFSKPPPPVLTPEEVLAANTLHQSNLMYVPMPALCALYLTIDLGSGTDEATVEARKWQNYYREVQAVDLTDPSPSWPAYPE